jgi:hypothetical protein
MKLLGHLLQWCTYYSHIHMSLSLDDYANYYLSHLLGSIISCLNEIIVASGLRIT